MREDFRAGQVCATVANYAGKMRGEGVSPANPAEFMPSLRELSQSQDGRPILLPDRKAHAALLRKTIFNKDD